MSNVVKLRQEILNKSGIAISTRCSKALVSGGITTAQEFLDWCETKFKKLSMTELAPSLIAEIEFVHKSLQNAPIRKKEMGSFGQLAVPLDTELGALLDSLALVDNKIKQLLTEPMDTLGSVVPYSSHETLASAATLLETLASETHYKLAAFTAMLYVARREQQNHISNWRVLAPRSVVNAMIALRTAIPDLTIPEARMVVVNYLANTRAQLL